MPHSELPRSRLAADPRELGDNLDGASSVVVMNERKRSLTDTFP